MPQAATNRKPAVRCSSSTARQIAPWQSRLCIVNRLGYVSEALVASALEAVGLGHGVNALIEASRRTSLAAEGTEAVLQPKTSAATAQCTSNHAGHVQAGNSLPPGPSPSFRLVGTALWLRGQSLLLAGVDFACQALRITPNPEP